MTKKVLIIEDNENNRYLLNFLLQLQGYEVILAEDGIEGIQKAQNHLPDFILLDIQLPGMDGFEVAKRMKQDELLKKIPIIAVTAYAMTGDKEKILSSNFNGYIAKPIDPDNFIDKMNKALDAIGK